MKAIKIRWKVAILVSGLAMALLAGVLATLNLEKILAPDVNIFDVDSYEVTTLDNVDTRLTTTSFKDKTFETDMYYMKTLSEEVKSALAINPEASAVIDIGSISLHEKVMLTDDKEYYLRKGYDESFSVSGTPFFDTDLYNTNLDVTNIVVYGQNTGDNYSFSKLQEIENLNKAKDTIVTMFFNNEVRYYKVVNTLNTVDTKYLEVSPDLISTLCSDEEISEDSKLLTLVTRNTEVKNKESMFVVQCLQVETQKIER